MVVPAARTWLLVLCAGCGLGLAVAGGAAPGILVIAGCVAIALLSRSRFAGIAIVTWTGVWLAAAPRMVTTIVGAGAGLIPLGAVATILLALAATLGRSEEIRAVRRSIRGIWPAAVFLGAWACLPVLGVIAGYPVRTMMSAVTPLSMLAFFSLGVVGRRSEKRFWSGIYWAVLGAVWAGAAAALIQGGGGGATLSWLAPALRQWDLLTAGQYGVATLSGRQVGLYVNPNEFALLGAYAVLYAVLADGVTSRRRYGMALPGAFILIVSSSRAVLVATIVALVLDRAFAAAGAKARPIVARIAAFGGLAGAAALANVYLPERVAYFFGRAQSGVDVVRLGAGADANLAGRLTLWKGAYEFIARHPLGSLGPPHMAIGSSIDNEFIAFAVQGGVLMLALYMGMIGVLHYAGRSSENGRLLRGIVVLVAIAALSQASLASSASTVMLWVVAGACCTIGREVRGHLLLAEVNAPCDEGTMDRSSPART